MADAHITVTCIVPSKAGAPQRTDSTAGAGKPDEVPFLNVLAGKLDAVPTDATATAGSARGDRAKSDDAKHSDKNDDTSAATATPTDTPVLVLPPVLAPTATPQPVRATPVDTERTEQGVERRIEPSRGAPTDALAARPTKDGSPQALLIELRATEARTETPRDSGSSAPAAPAATVQTPAALPLLQTTHALQTPQPAYPISAPINSPHWPDEVGNRLTLMVRDRVQAAELHVHPPELGPVSVRIDVSGSEANVTFTAPHAETRAAVEAALPRLREMLADQGVALTGANVGSGFEARRDQPSAPAERDGERTSAPVAGAALPPALVRHGLVDVFA